MLKNIGGKHVSADENIDYNQPNMILLGKNGERDYVDLIEDAVPLTQSWRDRDGKEIEA